MRQHKHRWYDIINWFSPKFRTVTIQEDPKDLNPTDYTEIDKDGIYLRGSSTVWDDIQSSLIGQRLYSTPGTVDYNYTNSSVTFEPSGVVTSNDDVVIFNIQFPHSAKSNGSFNIHVHWEQVDTTVRTWTLQYRIQENGGAKETTWITVSVDTGSSSDLFTYTSGTLNQITRLVDIDMTPYGLSSVVQVRLTRSDSEAGDIEATFVDAHYEIDTLGSREEYVK